jgi:hypothetical protein
VRGDHNGVEILIAITEMDLAKKRTSDDPPLQ